ncbi:hypothetical protein H7U32_05900 [Bifidobacterium pullorum subsp. saeculare]|uniref:Uncharacterized protein n=1 Tax=Bifidobacterium pullorum subsp. saeculare TaxID=78257 RepID=A0A938WXT9_9BIFI|nr:hypothetical protein [Bifidobacterium pullorum]MBM6699851.1 hypothetical protein [Bifidobacterium pullorum subsp. saeculare]
MRFRTIAAMLLSVIFVLPLGGCSSIFNPGKAASQAKEESSSMQKLTDALSGIGQHKRTRLVVKDAATGKVIRETADQDEIDRVFDPLRNENGIARKPDAPAEYVLELWQPETRKLGQSANDLKEYKAVTVTTYRDSPVVAISVVPVRIRLCLSSPSTADALRALAK